MLQYALDLRRVAQIIVYHGVVQRLDAEVVARQKDRLVILVVDSEGEHTAQHGQHILAPLLKTVYQHLAVSVGSKGMSLRLKLFSELLIVIDLAVEGEHEITVLVSDRLIACIEVDY